MTGSWMRAVVTGLGLAAMGALPAAAGEESILVLRSTVPSIASGAMLTDGQTIDLPADGEVEVVSITGIQTTITGPYKGVLEVRGPKIEMTRIAAMGEALLGRDEGTSVLGATRGAGQPDVLIDVSSDGVWCVFEKSETYLMRDGRSPETATLISTETNETANIDWARFKKHLQWPEGLALRDGATYRLERGGHDPVAFRINMVAHSDDAMANLFAMAEKNCSAQVEVGMQALRSK